ncbi:MAG: hypothetical protein ABW034_02375 [Steroidobacteraceae bacterium]
MSRMNQLLCAHSALVFATLLGLGIFGIAGWMPLIEPSMSAAELAAEFEQNRWRIRFGMSVLAFAAMFWWLLSAAIAMQMKRIEGNSHPLTYVQMASSCGTVMIILLAAYFWLVAAYRADTAPDTIRMLSDFAWITFIGFYPPGFIQNVSIGWCILTDRNEVKAYPRWVGYANLWLAVLFLPGALLPFFHGGPFSWNGLIGFWLVAFAFFGWILMMWHMTVRAIKSDPTLT